MSRDFDPTPRLISNHSLRSAREYDYSSCIGETTHFYFLFAHDERDAEGNQRVIWESTILSREQLYNLLKPYLKLDRKTAA